MPLLMCVITPLMMCHNATDALSDNATDDVCDNATVYAEKDSPCTSGIFAICIFNIQLRAKELKVKAIAWLSHSHCDIRPLEFR
jgi:hypothetical protein